MVIYWSKIRRPVYGTATVKELNRFIIYFSSVSLLSVVWIGSCVTTFYNYELEKPIIEHNNTNGR